MAYDFVAYQADRTTLNFVPMVEVTAKGLGLRRRRMLGEMPADPDAINAAHDRLLAWLASGAAEPEAPPAPADATPELRAGVKALAKALAEAKAAEAKAWAEALAAQRDRHARRRSGYPDVDPQAKPKG